MACLFAVPEMVFYFTGPEKIISSGVHAEENHTIHNCSSFLDSLTASMSFPISQLIYFSSYSFSIPFSQIDSGDEWRSETCLTLSLINSISSRFPAANSCVSVSFSNCNRETADLNHLQVNYVVKL